MLLAHKARNHPKRPANDDVDDRAVPAGEFWALNRRFNFTIDAAASDKNARLPRYWTRQIDALIQPWSAERIWCNPPYSNLRPWIQKAWQEKAAELIVMLLPANRTEQPFWQDLIEPHRDRHGSPLRVEFLPNRMRFLMPGAPMISPNSRPPFGCCLLIWSWSTHKPTHPELSLP